jgi:hypothetical protein
MPMDPQAYIIERQRLWAERHGIRLGSSLRHADSEEDRERGAKTRVYDLDDNLFEPLMPEARQEFEAGDGGELKADSGDGNMYAVHSSSALCCNVFHYWRRIGQFNLVAQACRLPSTGIQHLRFEVKRPIADGFDRAPNLDVEIGYEGSSRLRASAFECKFGEPFGREHPGLKKAYLDETHLWQDLPVCQELAIKISPDDRRFKHLHAAQLLKHILGLKNSYGKEGFRLLYLWYAVPGSQGVQHAQEIEEFAEYAVRDGIQFQSSTYQQVIARLARDHRESHQPYIDYLTERYF